MATNGTKHGSNMTPISEDCGESSDGSFMVTQRVSGVAGSGYPITGEDSSRGLGRASVVLAEKITQNIERKASTPSNKSIMTFSVKGQDRPGIAKEILGFISAIKDVEIADMSQVNVSGYLLMSFKVTVTTKFSTSWMTKIMQMGKKKDLVIDIDFNDRATAADLQDEDGAQLGQCVESRFIYQGLPSVKLLKAVSGVFMSNGLNIEEIEQDKGKYPGLKFNCSMTTDAAATCSEEGFLFDLRQQLQTATQSLEQDIHISCRWFDPFRRPLTNGVVCFGLCHGLVPYRVHDEIMDEARKLGGTTPDCEMEASTDNETSTPAEASKRMINRISKFKGVPAQAVDNFLDRVEYTTNAEFTCRALKRMGFKLGIITATAIKKVAYRVKEDLGLDYVFCEDMEIDDEGKFTGKLGSDASDVRFRRQDIIRLVSDKEGVSGPRIFLVSSAFIQEPYDHFFTPLHFNANKTPDMIIVLRQMGFSSFDVESLGRIVDQTRSKSYEMKFPEGHVVQVQEGAKRSVLRMSSSSGRCPGLLYKLMNSISECEDTEVVTIRQCAMHNSLCIGIELYYKGQDAIKDTPTKELLFVAAQQKPKVAVDINSLPHDYKSSSLKNDLIVTVVQQPHVSVKTLAAITVLFSKSGINIVQMNRLSFADFSAFEMIIRLPPSDEPVDAVSKKLKQELIVLAQDCYADISLQKADVLRWGRRLVVFDMDSTLIQGEVINELAALAGVEEEVSKITASAMRGEIDFKESLIQRCALLKGHDQKKLFDEVKARIVLMPGALELCTTLRQLGFRMAVVSGGFRDMARHVADMLGLHYAFANELEVDGKGMLTGRTLGPIVTPERKKQLKHTIAELEGCSIEQTVAVGDGANDIPMLTSAGLGIAFCAKPKVQESAKYRVNQKDLSTILYLLGLKEKVAIKAIAAKQLKNVASTNSMPPSPMLDTPASSLATFDLHISKSNH